MQANARLIKNYRHKLMDKITASVRKSFDDAEIQATDGVGFLDDLTWMFKDLDRIETDVRPLFPEDYNIWEFFVKAYHTRLNEALQGIVKSNPEARVLLRMHAWIKEYRGVMKEFEVPAAWLQPALLDGKSQDLIEDYVALIVDKFDKWTINLMRTEQKDFTSRDAPPETDQDGTYVLQFAVIMFQMANQQVDLAADSGQGAVLARVVAESGKVMMSCQAQWLKILEREYNRQVAQPESAPPGLVEYVVALANDQLKAADYAESMSSRLEPLVSAKYQKLISERINEAIDGYLDVAKKCIQTLIDLIFNDLKGVTKNLFTLNWYAEPLMDQIVETMKDYTQDYRGHLNQAIFDILIEDMLVQFLSIYLNAIRRVPARGLRIPSALEKIKSDTSKVFMFFNEYKKEEDLSSEFEIIDQLLSMLAASPEMIFMDYWQFAKKHGPNLPFIEALLRGRDDMDKVTLNEVLETLRRKIREEGLGEPEEPTIMVSGQDRCWSEK
jgi:exocyst complex component 3